MKTIIVILLLALPAHAKFKIAVIDTGYNTKHNALSLCEEGHKDFTGKGIHAVNPHGQNVSHIIENMTGKADYCQVIIKYFHHKAGDLGQAIEYAASLDVQVINISSGGIGEDKREKRAVKKALDTGILIVTAAGNDNLNLDKGCIYYPACYDLRIIVVGNLISKNKKNPSSNYGSVVDYWPIATKISGGGITLTGTSQGAAIMSGSIARSYHERHIANTDEVMVRKVSHALYKQWGIEYKVMYLKNKYVSKEYQDVFALINWSGNAYAKQEYIIKYKWSFK